MKDATIVFDLGAVYTIARFALWNEEGAGLATLAVETSIDAIFSTPAAAGSFVPKDNVYSPDEVYAAEVFSLAPSVGRYVRLNVSGPQVPFDIDGLSMGEIA